MLESAIVVRKRWGIDVIHHEKCSARHTRRRQINE